MAKLYDHKKIESKWQKEWDKKQIYQARDFSKKPKYYALVEFPYPSSDGLHVGHPRPYIGMDVVSRKRRMEGFNVLYPMGWDAFGLPTENYAIKTGQDPRIVTRKNTDTFRRQIKSLGTSFDWSREINTADPEYYKWTQWIFLQFLKKGLTYKAKMAINWCPKDKIGLANEEVVGGCCERCGTPVEKREKEQWMLAITKYAERLDKDLDTVDYLPQIKLAQRNWIGKSEGAEIDFKIISLIPGIGEEEFSVKVFTTRPDTIFGATYLVLAPEHELVQKLKTRIKNWVEVEKYIKKAKNKTEIDRTGEDKIKTGVELKGIKAINPADTQALPVWIADYVLPHYGTGAIMAVPAHDQRDFVFAKKYDLEIEDVVAPYWLDSVYKPQKDKKTEKREVVTIIVKDPQKSKVLCLKWKTTNWQSFPTGGIEDGEDLEKTARREILEETGYKNLKFVEKIPGSTYVELWRPHKGSNAYAHFYYLVFNLENEEKKEINENEKKNHEPIWVPEKEVLNFVNVENQKFMWQRFNSGDSVFVGDGILVNSGKFNGLDSEKAKKEIIKFVGGKEKTTFKLRDWIFSRQHYWGEPIPVVHCPACAKASAGKENAGWIPVPEKDLPVELPKVKNYQPTDSGESPLANIAKWVNVKCPKCKGKAKRETDTMPNWAGSSWYYLRYTDPKNKKAFADKKNLKYWLPVDWYNGGNEHTTLHLLYSRFWHKFLFDLKLVPTAEPYKKRTSHGMILGEGGVKMSKSLGNVINPDEIVKIYGADTLRVYEMFIGPFNQSVTWSTESIIGARRFIEKVWRIGEKVKRASLKVSQGMPLELLHKTIKKVSEDIENMHFNTAISALMILATEMEKAENISTEDFKKFLQILNPFAPHLAEELWNRLGEKQTINFSSWPEWDEKLIQAEEIKIAVQVNGKVRAEIMIRADDGEKEAGEKALANEAVLKHIAGRDVKKMIYVKNKLMNIVI
jgi:leucyl-tRNA synthetase